MLARRTTLFGTSGTAAARAAAAAAASSGKEIIDLTAGEIWAGLSPTIRKGAMAAIEQGRNRYTDTVGLPELKQALAERIESDVGGSWGPDEVAVTAGAKQALFHAAMVLLDPGHEVIIPAPYWTTFPAQVLLAGGVPVFVDTRNNDYVPRLCDIESAITPNTRAIIVNTPGNPTGSVYDAATLRGLADLALSKDLWLIFDECYGTFAYAPHEHLHLLRVAPDVRSRTLVVNAFSKQLALTGWRIGYLAGPPAVIKAAKALQSHTTSNPNVIAQYAVLSHLREDDGSYEQALYRQLTQARRMGLEVLSELERVRAPRAQGGFYFYLDLEPLLKSEKTSDRRNADDVVTALLGAGVATVSGTAFGDSYGLRVSYGSPPEQLEVGLRRVVEVLNAWR